MRGSYAQILRRYWIKRDPVSVYCHFWKYRTVWDKPVSYLLISFKDISIFHNCDHFLSYNACNVLFIYCLCRVLSRLLYLSSKRAQGFFPFFNLPTIPLLSEKCSECRLLFYLYTSHLVFRTACPAFLFTPQSAFHVQISLHFSASLTFCYYVRVVIFDIFPCIADPRKEWGDMGSRPMSHGYTRSHRSLKNLFLK